MLAALDPLSLLLGAAGAIVLFGAVLAALGQIGRAWSWALQRFRPTPPRVELESSGGMHSSEKDAATGEITWNFVRPSFNVRNDEPVSVYAVTAGIVDPASGDRIAHPTRIPVLKAETQGDFGSTDAFQIPPGWLAGFANHNPHQGVPYYVELTDSGNRKWEGIIDFREVVPRMRFRRVKG